MIKNYFLYNSENIITQCIRCKEDEIGLYGCPYVETELEDFTFDYNYNYFISNGEVKKILKTDTASLANRAYEELIFNIALLDSSVREEKSTWARQESEAKAYNLDNNSYTPFLDSLVVARGISKDDLVSKILVKSDAYTKKLGQYIGEYQKKIKDLGK